MANNQQDAQRKVLNRLRRARGQLDAVITAVEEGKSCRDVVTQLSAVSKALDRAGFAIVASAMKDCLANTDVETDGDNLNRMTPEELEKLFLTLS